MLDYNTMSAKQLCDLYKELVNKDEHPTLLSWLEQLRDNGKLDDYYDIIEKAIDYFVENSNEKKYKENNKTTLSGAYASEWDMTFIIEETDYLREDGSVTKTVQVVGWYFGGEDEDENRTYYGKTLGLIDYPAGEFDDEELKRMGLLK
jgi:hypothetical protein